MNIPNELLCNDLIFHFTKTSTAIENILNNGLMRFSPMDEMNDPYEYKISSPVILSDVSIDDERNREITKCFKNTILKKSKLACFVGTRKISENLYKYPFTKPRSWAQYGDSQEGICLGFRQKALLKNISDNVTEISIHDNFIEYNLDCRIASTKNTINYDANISIEENVYRQIDNNQADIYFRKYSDFLDEEEYRIVVIDKSKVQRKYISCPINGALEYIILGDKFNKEFHELVRSFGVKFSAKTFRLECRRVPYMYEL